VTGETVPIDAAPLASSLRRLGRCGDAPSLVLGRPTGPEWLALDDVDAGLDLLLEQGEAAHPGSRDYVAATLACAVSGAVVDAGLALLLVERRLPDLDLAGLRTRRSPDELWFGQVAIHGPRITVLPDDPAAAHRDVTVVPALADLHQRFVDLFVGALTPWFDGLRRRRVPFGTAGMWGQAADEVTGTALRTARAAGLDERASWDEALSIVGRLGDRLPRLRARPRPFPVEATSGSCLFQVKGTCCLWYRIVPDADPAGEGYCVTCPKRTDADRLPRLVAHLDETTAP
jgi:hypothetical protein